MTPRTEAGRALLRLFFEDEGFPLDPAATIVAIEDEARQQGVEKVEAVLRKHLMAAVISDTDQGQHHD